MKLSKVNYEITDKYNTLKKELLKLILERDNLIDTVIPNIEAEYQLKIGFFEYDKFKLQLEINRMKRAIEIIQSKLNSSEHIDIIELEEILDKDFEKWQVQLSEYLEKLEIAKIRKDSPTLTDEESEELSNYYKKLVKLLHPDINPENFDKNKDLWMRVMESYKNGDIESLKTLLILVEDLKEEENPNNTFLEKRINQIKDSIKNIIKEIENIKSNPPYIYIEKLKNKHWIISKQESIKKDIAKLKEYKEQVERIYDKYLENII